MTHQGRRARTAVLLSLTLAASLLIAPAWADEPQRSFMERKDREMLRLRVQIQNGQMRLELGLTRPIEQEVDPEEATTPWRLCCPVNLKKLQMADRELTAIFAEWESCHRAAGNHGAVAALGFARNDLSAFSQGARILADAPTQDEALAALRGLTRLYFNLEKSLEGVGACGTGTAPAPEQEAAEDGKKEKKKKKKDRRKERKKKQEAEEETDG